MNKLLTKIVGLSLGLSMAIGVGVAASFSGKDAVRVDAVDETLALNSIGTGLSSTANTTMSATVVNSYTLNYLQCKKQGESMFMTKSVSPFISNHTVIPGTIKSVTLTINSGAAAKTTYDVAFGTSEYTTATSGIGAVNITGGNSHTYENYSGGKYTVAGANYFCITLGNANNGQVLNISVLFDNGQAAQSHTISFDAGEGTGTMASASSQAGTYVLPSTATFTAPSNKILKGWRIGSTDYKLGDTYTFSTTTENITATALWIKDATSSSNPYSVAEARDAIDFGVGLSNVHVAGIISQVDSYNSTYKSITYWISDDGTTTNQFEVYSGKGLNGDDFSAVTDLSTGLEVVVKGNIKKYNSTYEFNQNSQIISKVDPSKTLSSVTIGGTMELTSYHTNDSWDPTGLTATANYSDSSTEDVTSSVTWSYSPLTPAAMGPSATAQQLTVTATYQTVSGNTTVSVMVSDPVTSQYKSYTSAIVAGEYVILNADSSNALGDTISSNRVANVTAPSVSSGILSTNNEAIKYNIAANGDYWTLQNVKTGKYLAATSSKNQAAFVDSVDNHAKWTLTYSNGAWIIENLGRASDSDTPANRYLRNNGDNGWAAYGATQSTQGAPALFKKIDAATNPLTANPVLSTGASAVAHVGQDLTITVTTTPSDTDEELIATTTDTSGEYLTVSGSGKTFTVHGVALTSSAVTVTISGSEGVYSSSVQITVENPVKTVNDKVLTADGLGLSNSYVDKDEPGTYLFDGANFSVFYLCKTKGIQFHKADGYITNAEALSNQTTSYIKAITLIMHSDNAGTPAVYEGSATNPSTSVTVSGTFDATGINTYVFSSSMSYFKVGCDSATTNAVNIDNIIIELADSTSTALGNARTAAQKILTGLNGLCGESGSGLVTQAQWEAIATSVGTLDNDTKAILKGAVRVAINDLALGSATIENAMYHYDAVLAKFGYTDILEIGSSAAHTNTSPMIINSETAVVIITVIAAISITSIGALLVLKKRKEQF